ncbi:ribonuclease E inhibitor RraB [Paraferrimonas sp. SM1919]|uniref:ribonuclease E inhibitor RraB n=1 Tax=Paraferrimonas sp. SM1919 TaxID=2662263 RepID=UPI0013D2BD74|nr:ribonuclease E inhibitor RraB [Paraferrimonas sp. SM1919]
MSIEQILSEQFTENQSIVKELLADGSDPDALYTIEHHIASSNFETLERAAVECFKQGYEVTDAEQLELENGAILFSFDIIMEQELEVERLNIDCKTVIELCQNLGVEYDGWGTYFMDPDADYSQDQD